MPTALTPHPAEHLAYLIRIGDLDGARELAQYQRQCGMLSALEGFAYNDGQTVNWRIGYIAAKDLITIARPLVPVLYEHVRDALDLL
ncbi:MAG: hypothetical protein FJ276_36880 [Planctomycetes bacterium]|nr:hypothetical protein [Planctomycetota bacterium]